MATRSPDGPGDLSDFLFHASHDLKGALRTVRLHSELLAREHHAGDLSKIGEHLSAILGDTVRLERLADGLSRYAIALQMDQRNFVMAPMEAILRSEIASLKKELEECQAEVTYDPLPRVLGDPDRLRQVLDNLLRNALVHGGPAPPRIHITAQAEGEHITFAVRDSGLGIEPEYLERIFEPFERLKGHQAPGPGLGLTASREIVRRHGGRIWAESQPGHGATIFFTLPVS